MAYQTTLTHDGLEAAIAKLRDLEDMPVARLLDGAGGILESGARRRIAEDKASADGTPWVAWSERYDETREHGVHSLLMNDGDLLDSIQSYTTGAEAIVGSNMVYAAHQHEGSDTDEGGIPARPFLGMSDDDARDIEDLIEDFIERQIQ